MKSSKQQVISSFFWKVMQSSSVQIINFVISTVLARILDPSDYGIIAMTSVFLSIIMVFVNTGFSSAIVQKENVDDVDLSTMFWFGIALSILLYFFSFLIAPLIANFYNQPELTKFLRVGCLTIIISSLSSVHAAILSRNINFRVSFLAGSISALFSGIIGIALAIWGFGSWALSLSTLANSFIYSVALWIFVKWTPKLVFSFASFNNMYQFSVKVLLSSFFETLYGNIRSIVIGKQYSSTDLAFYNRGEHLPSMIMSTIDGAVSAVLFPTLSKLQNDWNEGLRLLRRSIRTSLYICLPILTGLFVVSKSLVIFLFTEKWAESITYVRLCSIICAFWPLSARIHALNARGRSDISLRLKILSISVSITLLLLTYKISVYMIVMSTIISVIICSIIGFFVYQKYLDYGIKEQLIDIFTPLSISLLMGLVVYSVELLNIKPFITLIIQVPLGVVVYILLSILSKNESFYFLLNELKRLVNKS